MSKGFYKWTVVIEVHPKWVADGFNLDDERLEEMVTSRGQLDHAYPSEIDVKVIRAPDPEEIRAEQGYEAKAKRRLCDYCEEIIGVDCECGEN